MKKILLLCLAFSGACLAQQPGWRNITANLPGFYRDTTIINGGADTIVAGISGISFIDDLHGWVSTNHPFDGDESAVLETTDGGETWTEHRAPLAGADIHMIDAQTGYLGAVNGFIYKTTNGARTWNLHGLLNSPLYDLGFPPRPAESGYAGGKNGRIGHITPQGVSPSDPGPVGNVYCIDFPSVERGYALLDYQMIIFFRDGAWNVEASYPFSSKNWLYFRNDTLGWCVGEMFLKTNVGIDWFRTDPGFVQAGAMMGVFFTDDNHGWAVGTQGQIAYTSDGGNDWMMLEHNLTDAILTGVLFTSPGNGYIIGGDKTILHYSAAGGISGIPGSMFGISPNPTTGRFSVNCSQTVEVTLVLTDLYGKVLMTLLEGNLRQGKTEFDSSRLPAGIYLLRIGEGGPVTVRKVIRQ